MSVEDGWPVEGHRRGPGAISTSPGWGWDGFRMGFRWVLAGAVGGFDERLGGQRFQNWALTDMWASVGDGISNLGLNGLREGEGRLRQELGGGEVR